MPSCQSCGKNFSRKDSLLRHQRQFCNVIIPRKQKQIRIANNRKNLKSNNLIDLSSSDLIQVIASMLKDHQCQWKMDFKKLMRTLLKTKNSHSATDDDNEQDYTNDDDERDYSSDEVHSSSE